MGYRLESEFILIFVRDNGVGLSPEMLTQIFSMFTRVESDRDGDDGGLGIGLALSKGLVELHGTHRGAQRRFGKRQRVHHFTSQIILETAVEAMKILSKPILAGVCGDLRHSPHG